MSSWTNMFIDISWRDGYVNGFHEAESWQISDSQSLSKFQVPSSNFQVPTSKNPTRVFKNVFREQIG